MKKNVSGKQPKLRTEHPQICNCDLPELLKRKKAYHRVNDDYYFWCEPCGAKRIVSRGEVIRISENNKEKKYHET
jgi:hypothetical protein